MKRVREVSCSFCQAKIVRAWYSRKDRNVQHHYCNDVCKAHFSQQIFPERFWSRVEKTEYCWLWTGAKARNGYGNVHYHGVHLAHRVAWEITYGPIPEGMCILHRCDVRACVRPDHLFLGTHQDNTDDMVQKERNRNGDMKGENNPRAKLDWDKVKMLRTLYAEGEKSRKKFQIMFGISASLVDKILDNSLWPDKDYVYKPYRTMHGNHSKFKTSME